MDGLFGGGAGHGLDAADTGGDGAFGPHFEQADGAGVAGVRAAAQLHGVSEADHTDHVSVFFAEQGHGAHRAGFIHRGVAFLAERFAGADEGVDAVFDGAKLLVRHFLEVGEVEAEVIRPHERALLLHVGAQDFAQGLVQQMGGRVVVHDALATLAVHREGVGAAAVFRQLGGQMDGEVVFLHRIEDGNSLTAFALDAAAVSHLAAHFGIEGRVVEHQLEVFLVFLLHGALAQQPGPLHLKGVIPLEGHFLVTVGEDRPVSELVGGGVTGALFLLLKLRIETFQVHLVAFFGSDELRKVDGEAIGVIEHEGVGAGDHPGVGIFGHVVFQHADAAVQGAQEGVFLLADDILDEFLLGGELRIGLAHIGHQLRDEAAEERLGKAQESVTVADGAAQDAADDVAGLHVGRELPVGDGEGDGADVVGNHAHGHLHIAALGIFVAGEGLHPADEAGEDVGLVIALLVLENHAQALEAHAGVDVFGGQRHQVAVGHAVVLHEHEVPDFDDVVVVRVHEVAAGNAGDFLIGPEVDVDLAAGAAGAGVAHFPEIVVLVAGEHVVFRQMLEPCLAGFGVQLGAVFFGAFENGGVQFGGVNLIDLCEKFPGPVDGFGLEIVSEAPVSQHLEHGMVASVVAHGLQVVVLAAYAEALLAVGGTGELGCAVPEENVFELVHARVGEHEGRVIFDDHGGRGDHRVSLGGEEVQIFLAGFLGCHILVVCLITYKGTFFPVNILFWRLGRIFAIFAEYGFL